MQVSLQNTGLFCRALLQKRPIFLSILLIVATPYVLRSDRSNINQSGDSRQTNHCNTLQRPATHTATHTATYHAQHVTVVVVHLLNLISEYDVLKRENPCWIMQDFWGTECWKSKGIFFYAEQHLLVDRKRADSELWAKVALYIRHGKAHAYIEYGPHTHAYI